MPSYTTFAEVLYDNPRCGIRTVYRAKDVIAEVRTPHQHLVLFRHPFLGKVLMLDGVVQLTEHDASFYHEMMVHVPLFAHGGAERVLIVGGGDCGIAAEVIKHKTVTCVTQVEIDGVVVEFSKKHFPEFTGPVFADKRFALEIGDGMQYVANTQCTFDVIIVDSTDPQGPGKVLFSREFYAACKGRLNPRGILITQNGVPFLQSDELKTSVQHFRSLFRWGGCYLTVVPTYIGGYLAIGCASNAKITRSLDEVGDRYERAGSFPTHYWTPEVHVAAFRHPRFIQELLSSRGT